MAEYWRYADPRVAQPPQPVSGAMAAAVAAAVPPPSSSAPLKRPRPDYAGEKLPDWRYAERPPPGAAAVPPLSADSLKRPRPAEYDVPGGRDLPPYYPTRDEDRPGYRIVRDTEPIGASYDRYLRNGLSSAAAPEPPSRAGGGIGGYPLDDRRAIGARQEAPPLPLPPDASSTLYVEGLPSNCTRREVSHIFRPFVGYREVRLVNKEPKHKEGSTHILCFVDFASPAHAAVALDALQGYRLDDHDRDSSVLRLQFARNPGLRSGVSRNRRN